MYLSKILITIIFTELAVGILVIGLFLYFVKNKATQRAKMREAILQKQASSFGNATWFPVRYSSHKYFQSIWKFFAWENSGVMFLDEGSIFFIPESQITPSLNFDLNSSKTFVNWLGMKLWPNGFVYWFSIKSNGETHYFTSETGTFIFTSQKTTKDIYNKLQEYIGKINRA